jgi:dienelactone hydrolase
MRLAGLKAVPVNPVICEAFGLSEHIKDIARRFAHQTYLAMVPDLIRHRDALVTRQFQRPVAASAIENSRSTGHE